MSPAITPLVSALGRAADLIERGLKPAAALRQVVREMAAYESSHTGPIPQEPFDLGEPARVLERVI